MAKIKLTRNLEKKITSGATCLKQGLFICIISRRFLGLVPWEWHAEAGLMVKTNDAGLKLTAASAFRHSIFNGIPHVKLFESLIYNTDR